MNTLAKASVVLGVVATLQGCIYGSVRDAQTNAPVTGALVVVTNGNCSGAGCSATFFGNPYETTDSSGNYVFDAYDDDPATAADVKYISLESGQEALSLFFLAGGYQGRTVYHRPDYETVSYGGNSWLVSAVGETKLCPYGAADTDGDSLCDAAEAKYGTSATNSDTDGDGISDTAEIFGWNGVDLKAFGANPLRKNLFLEADYYPGLKPHPTAIQMVVDAFANAPVSNPDGSTGIDLYVDVDDQIAAGDVDNNLSPVWSDFDVIKNKYFPARRDKLFRYVLFANMHSGGTSSGKARGIPGHDFVVTLGAWSTPGGTIQQQAGTLMHELGHTIGLRHGGNENANRKVNYLSVMSYNYQTVGLRIDGIDGNVDYSRLTVGSIAENNLSEIAAMTPIGATSSATLARYGVRDRWGWMSGNASFNLDFNKNGVINAYTVVRDLDGDGLANDTFAASQNDWLNLSYSGAGAIGDSHLGMSALGGARMLSRSLSTAQSESVVHPDEVEECMTEFE